jgi:hypothetical protein
MANATEVAHCYVLVDLCSHTFCTLVIDLNCDNVKFYIHFFVQETCQSGCTFIFNYACE